MLPASPQPALRALHHLTPHTDPWLGLMNTSTSATVRLGRKRLAAETTALKAMPGALELADEMVDTGRSDMAATVMREAQRPLDPDHAAAHTVPLDAVLTYLTLGEGQPDADPGARTSWAHYAYRAARQAHGPVSTHATLAAWKLIVCLYDQGLSGPATATWCHLVASRSRREAIALRAGLAVVLHSGGHCPAALAEIGRARHAWQQQHPDDPAFGADLIDTQLLLLSACGLHNLAAAMQDSATALLPAELRPGTPAFETRGTAFVATVAFADLDGTSHAPICRIRRHREALSGTPRCPTM